jgi:hypothetical protein
MKNCNFFFKIVYFQHLQSIIKPLACIIPKCHFFLHVGYLHSCSNLPLLHLTSPCNNSLVSCNMFLQAIKLGDKLFIYFLVDFAPNTS